MDTLLLRAIDVGYLGLEGAAGAFVVQRKAGRSHGGALGRPILIECGTTACQPALHAGLARLAVDPDEIDTLLVTHIHLDHAGGAGHWATRTSERSPSGADVFVHPFGVRHLADPAKLIASSRRVHGSAYDRFYGDPLPCPPERLHAVADGETFVRHGIRCTAVETPGHARHHHAWVLSCEGADGVAADRQRVLFAGDIASMMTPGSRHISVPTPPPEFDLDAWRASLDRLVALRPDALWLTHLGPVPDPMAHLAAARRRLDEEVAFVLDLLEAIDQGLPDAEAIERYRAWLWPQAVASGVSEERVRAFLGPAFFRMNMGGIRRWRDQRLAAEDVPTGAKPVL